MKFSNANVKVERLYWHGSFYSWLTDYRRIYSADLLSGHSCPFASKCLSKVVIKKGKKKIVDGPDIDHRCYSASEEVIFPVVYDRRAGNYKQMRGLNLPELVKAIEDGHPDDLGICRIHSAGDFFNKTYFRAWLEIARNNKQNLYYAYTKSLPYWLEYRKLIPENMVLTASRGGRCDHLIKPRRLREAIVVKHPEDAEAMGLEIDHDDSHAANPATRKQNFALLIHGRQPPGSEASQALKRMKAEGISFSYKRRR